MRDLRPSPTAGRCAPADDLIASWWPESLIPGLAADRLAAVITAIVMVSTSTDSIPEVAQEIADIEAVSEVYSVAGHVDLIAIVRVRDFDDIASVIAGQISKVPGVLDTETHIAFRAYSRHDLDAAFSIGFETEV